MLGKVRFARAQVATLVAAAAASPMIGIAAPAHAEGCITEWQWASTDPGGSSKFNASIGCSGVWALRYEDTTQYIRGSYYRDGAWHQSSYGWIWITSGSNNEKIIGNTVDGRRCRTEAWISSDNVRLKF